MNKTLSLALRHALESVSAAETSLPSTADFTGFREKAERLVDCLLEALFPAYAPHPITREEALSEAADLLSDCLRIALPASPRTEEIVLRFLGSLGEVRRLLGTDLAAAYRGDPAAMSEDEVILCYPAFHAIGAYRLAHVLYLEQVPLLPRAMTEYAHRKTGIDIHPGATIGESFFIDHGTGVVIGETTTIGREVKLYQHVTLGAKSFDAAPDGSLVKGIKRHPDIGNRVVIYSGATILGGDTRVGNDCVIGGSVWLTHSVPAGKLVLAKAASTGNSLTRDILAESSLDSAML
ncbi:MAG: serine acetyltransferase [Clostridiales bacterium]|nr:serine acetyltransferase [Clostridiales bacterium]